jgi:hypothetical protein
MGRHFLWCASALFLISAPAMADQHRILLNCAIPAGAEHGTVFLIDFGKRTVSVASSTAAASSNNLAASSFLRDLRRKSSLSSSTLA